MHTYTWPFAMHCWCPLFTSDIIPADGTVALSLIHTTQYLESSVNSANTLW